MEKIQDVNHSFLHYDMNKPSFIITIDTEGDNLWSRPRKITTKNAGFLHRFQSLCESYDLKPTYLTNYEMAISPVFQELGRDVLKRGAGEIGMHLHAWDTPPLISLTADDFFYHPYLTEYPENVMREKIKVMTDLLEDTFCVKMISHRAGKYSFNETYAHILVENRYRVDCSVTPFISWKRDLGDPEQGGGPDYTRFPDEAYFIDLNDVSSPGSSPLLEVPVTIASDKWHLRKIVARIFKSYSHMPGALNKLFPVWFRPNGGNLKSMLVIMEKALCENKSYVALMLHSSELMPGGSPIFPGENDIENLYAHLEQIFDAARETFRPSTLKEYYNSFTESEH